MSHSEIQRHRVMLEAKKAELSFGLSSREDIAIEMAADTLDKVQYAGERELAILKLARESELLRSICSALTRIENDTYGVCLHCDTDINPKRLAAIPWAEYCLECQEEADRRQLTETEHSPLELLAAKPARRDGRSHLSATADLSAA